MSIQVERAEASLSMWAPAPELQLRLRDPVAGHWPSDPAERLLRTGTWHRADPGQVCRDPGVIYAADGDYHVSRRIRVDPNGPYEVAGEDGQPWKYSGWSWHPVLTVPGLGEMAQVSCRYVDSGNIWYAQFSRALVEAKIREAGLEFEVRNYRVFYTGPMELIRDANIYQNCNGLTWGAQYHGRPYVGALPAENWGGAHWPDQAAAQAAADRYVRDGTKEVCAHTRALRARYPDHPVVPAVEAYEAGEQLKRAS